MCLFAAQKTFIIIINIKTTIFFVETMIYLKHNLFVKL